MRKWTVATVNWKSFDYLYYQLKMLYEYNDPDEFEFVVYDNVFPNQKEELEELRRPYEQYNNFRIMYWDGGSYQAHGLSLTHILRTSNTKYFLSNDPDHFWTIKGHLKYLESYLEAGNHAVGPVHVRINFPAIWGAAFFTEEIKDLELLSDWATCPKCGHYHLVDLRQDTGWQTWVRLRNKPFHVFETAEYAGPNFGSHSYQFYPTAYTDNGKLVGVHFFRGDYPNEDPNEPLRKDWSEARRAYGKYFYESAI